MPHPRTTNYDVPSTPQLQRASPSAPCPRARPEGQSLLQSRSRVSYAFRPYYIPLGLPAPGPSSLAVCPLASAPFLWAAPPWGPRTGGCVCRALTAAARSRHPPPPVSAPLVQHCARPLVSRPAPSARTRLVRGSRRPRCCLLECAAHFRPARLALAVPRRGASVQRDYAATRHISQAR